jgi:hypothetical protein
MLKSVDVMFFCFSNSINFFNTSAVAITGNIVLLSESFFSIGVFTSLGSPLLDT